MSVAEDNAAEALASMKRAHGFGGRTFHQPFLRTGWSFKTGFGTLEDYLQCLRDCLFPPIWPLADNNPFPWIRWINAVRREKGADALPPNPRIGLEIKVRADNGRGNSVVDDWVFYPFATKHPDRPHNDGIDRLVLLYEEAVANGRDSPELPVERALAFKGLILAGGRVSPELLAGRGDWPVGESFREGEELDDGVAAFIITPSWPAKHVRQAVGLCEERGQRIGWSGENRWPAGYHDHPPLSDGSILAGAYQLNTGRAGSVRTTPQQFMTDSQLANYCKKRFGYDEEYMFAGIADIHGLLSVCAFQPRRIHFPKSRLEGELGMEELCEAGARDRGVNVAGDGEYAKRYRRELEVVRNQGFQGYFMMVAEMVANAKSADMLVGPARGSSCGSLICWLLRITEVDPIRHGLLFERFLDESRNDPPDIDLDFPDTRREEVISGLMDAYGRDKVASLGTVNYWRPKSIVAEMARNNALPRTVRRDELETAIEAGEEKASEEVRLKAGHALAVGVGMNGHPRLSGKHAAGVIMSADGFAGTTARNAGNVLCMDMHDAAQLGGLKLDVLGLTQLEVLESFGRLRGISPAEFYQIPISKDDYWPGGNAADVVAKVVDVFNKRRYSGVFQFGSGTVVQNLAESIKFEGFDDVVAITAFARPGPLDSGATKEWIRRKNMRPSIEYELPELEGILGPTLGVMVFQEQVMQTMRVVGRADWEWINKVRRSISKSVGAEVLEEYRMDWIMRGDAAGVSHDVLNRIWDRIVKFGRYGFNKSHATAYAKISWWCAWAKSDPGMLPDFYARTLSRMEGEKEFLPVLREAAEDGVGYKAVDSDSSGLDWQAVDNPEGGKMLLGPLTLIPGLGRGMAEQVVGARRRKERLPLALAKKIGNPRTAIDSLYPIKAAIESLNPDFKALGIVSDPVPIKSVSFKKDFGNDVVVMGRMDGLRKKPGDGKWPKIAFYIHDDSGKVFAQVPSKLYHAIGKELFEKGQRGMSLIALKGSPFLVGTDFPMISVRQWRYLGESPG